MSALANELAPQDDGDDFEHGRPQLRLVQPIDETLEALQQHYGESGRVVIGYDAVLQKDYVGTASNKRQIDGRMIVDLLLAGAEDEAPQAEVLIFDSENRPLPEGLAEKLGATANRNWSKGKGSWRDF